MENMLNMQNMTRYFRYPEGPVDLKCIRCSHSLICVKITAKFCEHLVIKYNLSIKLIIAGDDIRQKLEFHHVHLELGALRYIETFLFYWSWGFFQKKNHEGRFLFLKIQGI